MNKFAGPCHRPRCGKQVAAETGERLRADGKWVVQHRSGECPRPPEPATAASEDAKEAPPPQKNRPICTPDGSQPLTGYFTAELEGGGHLTVRIRKQHATSSFRPGQIIVSYLTGSDNTSDYTRVAHVDERGRCWLWKRYQSSDRLRQAIAAVLGDQKAAGEAWARASQSCWKCGLMLTTPESLDRLMGDECYSKLYK